MGLIKYNKIKLLGHSDNTGILKIGDDICIQEKMDGCFSYNTRILLDDYTMMPIGKIVNNKLKLNAISYNTKTGLLESKPIVGWYKNGQTNNWLTIKIKGKHTSRCRKLEVTPNHMIYTKDYKKIQASQLKIGDSVYVPKYKINDFHKQIILASLIGDGNLCIANKSNHPYYREAHCIKQKSYAKFKINILRKYFNIKEEERKSQFGYPSFIFRTSNDKRLHDIYDKLYINGKKTITIEYLNQLNTIGLAVWYMDDGSVNFSNKQRPRVVFHTEGFSKSENYIISKFFKSRGYDNSVYNVKNGKYYVVALTANGTEKLFGDIYPYISKCMDYKIPMWLRNNNNIDEVKFISSGLDEVTILDIQNGKSNSTRNYKFDIEIKDNHNYFADYTLVSNSNTRFMLKDGKLIFGSRNTILGTEDNDEIKDGQFSRFINYVLDNINRDKLNNMYNDRSLIFYGEQMVKHTVNYKWDDVPAYIGFDIYDIQAEKFLHWTESKQIFEDLGLPFTKVYISGKYNKKIKKFIDKDKYPSEYAVDGIGEGIVIKNYDQQLYAKKYSEGFKERFHKQFGKSKKKAKNHNEKFLETYITVHAIEKQIYGLIDEGEKLDRTMMSKLPMRVWKDCWEEEWETICMKRWTLNLGKLKNMMAKRCLRVLDRMITNRELSQR